MKRAAALAVTLCIAACATPTHWERAGATERDLRMELAQCRVVAAGLPRTGDGLGDAAVGMKTIDNCMVGKGWDKLPSK